MYKNSILTNTPTACQQSAGLGHEPVDVGHALVPQLYRDVDDVCHETKCRQWGVEKQGEQAPFVRAMFLKYWRSVLGRHEDN